MLKFKKVYIDSSYKVNGTSSEFTIDLPETVQLEDNMLCQTHEVSIPHSWYSINETNNNFYNGRNTALLHRQGLFTGN